jgi:hypothetical protein
MLCKSHPQLVSLLLHLLQRHMRFVGKASLQLLYELDLAEYTPTLEVRIRSSARAHALLSLTSYPRLRSSFFCFALYLHARY